VYKAKGNNMKYNELSKNKLFGNNVFVFSASSPLAAEHYDTSVVNGVDLNKILYFIKDKNIQNTLNAEYSNKGKAYLWAGKSMKDGSCRIGNDERYWEMMQYGDLILIYAKRSIVSITYFVEKLKSSELGEYCWKNSQRPYDLVYFIGEPRYLSKPISVKTITDNHGMAYLGKVYQGLRRAARSNDILKDFGSLNNFAKTVFGINFNQ
jgi:hypothetical protein